MRNAELVERICRLGLTSKQAKVYASILNLGARTIAEVSEKTALHEQDIYKIISKLEKMGLVTKTIPKPIRVEAVAIEKALSNLIDIQEKTIEYQKKNIKEIIAAVNNSREPCLQAENAKFILLPPKSNAYKNKVELAFQNARSTYDLFIAQEFLLKGKRAIIGFLETFRPFSLNGVKARVLIRDIKSSKESEEVYNEETWPQHARSLNIIIKKTYERVNLFYAVIDGKELWIPLEFSGPPNTLLFTNSQAVVRLAQENFNKFWEDKNTVTILDKKAS